MPSTDTSTSYAPMESPGWLEPFPGDFFNSSNQPHETWAGTQPSYTYYPQLGWEDRRNASNALADQQEYLRKALQEGMWKEGYNAAGNYKDLYNKTLNGESLAPEYSAQGDFMKNYMGMVAKPEDYSSFMADDDYYSALAKELLGNKMTIGYGDQSMSFLPGKTATAYADILGDIMGTKSEAAKAYAAEKVQGLESYPALVDRLTSAEYNAANNLSDWTKERYNYATDPYLADYSLALAPYQTRLNESTTNPAGSWWNEGTQDYYNMWSPFELARYYMPSSNSSTDYNRDAIDILGSLTGILGGANAMGLPDLLGSALGGLFGGGGSGYTYSSPGGSAYNSMMDSANNWMNPSSGGNPIVNGLLNFSS